MQLCHLALLFEAVCHSVSLLVDTLAHCTNMLAACNIDCGHEKTHIGVGIDVPCHSAVKIAKTASKLLS